MKTVTISIATTPAGHSVLSRDLSNRAQLVRSMRFACEDAVEVELYTWTQGFGADEIDGVHEPCCTVVCGVNSAQAMVDLKAAMLEIARDYGQRSIAWVTGDTDILSTEVK